MEKASIHDFLLTGCIGKIMPGVRLSTVEQLLGPPDGSYTWSKVANHVFYGCLQLQCNMQGTVTWVVVNIDDRFPTVGSLTMEPWRIYQNMTPDEFKRLLTEHNMRVLECNTQGEILLFEVERCSNAAFLPCDNGFRLSYISALPSCEGEGD